MNEFRRNILCVEFHEAVRDYLLQTNLSLPIQYVFLMADVEPPE